MWRAFWASVVLATIAMISLSFETSCKHLGPINRCRGSTVNRRFVPGTTTPEDACTECIEGACCDLVGDCQDNACANEVAAAHACVEDAGRAASIDEAKCRTDHLKGDQSKKVYQCMRESCDDQCKLPTCELDPLVPPLGDPECDRCFAQGCCELMNDCAKDRTCLLALRCIIDECRDDFATELSIDRRQNAERRVQLFCDGGAPRIDPDADIDDGDNRGPGCFANCVFKTFAANDPQAVEAQCLAVKINECGAAVDCATRCRVSSASSDAGTGAPTDASAD
jgi:hypothetical protein